MTKNLRIVLAGALILIGSVIVLCWSFHRPVRDVNRAELEAMMKNHSITEAKVLPSTYTGIYAVEGTQIVAGKPSRFALTTHLTENDVQELLAQSEVKIEVPGRSLKFQLLNLVPTLLIGGLIIFVLWSQLSIGRGRKHRVRQRPSIRLKDVAGIEEAKAEVEEVVDFLKYPKKYRKLGGKLPKGILLIGPPGTGKTMLAKAIAGEADANFFSAHGSDFNEIFVGVGAKRIREIFRQATKNRPAIIFIDEIDCLGRKRKFDGHGEMQQTMNALLSAMDGFESSDGVVVLAATNRPEDLDEALTRQGRFDRKVHVPLPDRKGRRAILEAHTVEKPVQNREKTLDILAQTTTEMSGADLAGMINEAAILCAQRNLPEIGLSELEESRDKVRWGKERKSMVLRKEEREMVAYHEAGHTMVNLQKSLLPPLYKVSIIPRGGALGVTTLMPNEDQNLHSKAFLLQELVVLMGGRAAEKIFYGVTTNGAHGDLEMAKKIARSMIHDWGMGEKLYYELDQKEAEVEINRLLEAADREALAIIAAEKANTEKLARMLLQHETLTREEVVNLLYENQAPVDNLVLA
jgi:cell division protease FtsH